MVKFLKPGKVVVILSGRFAGKKAVIVKLDEEANGEQKKYHSCTVVGIERYPRRVYRGMSEKTIKRRCSMKPFIKSINLTHIMPTRYNFDLKELIPENTAFTADKKEESKKAIRKQFETVYLNQANIKSEKSKQGCAYFFKKLRF